MRRERPVMESPWCTASKKGRKDSATQTKPVAECVHDKLCKPNTDWKFLRVAKPACALHLRTGTSPRPLPSDSCFPSQLVSGRDTQARTAASNNSDESLILSACGEKKKMEWVWLRGPSGRELRVHSTGRKLLLLPPPARQHRLPDPLLPPLVPAHFSLSIPLPQPELNLEKLNMYMYLFILLLNRSTRVTRGQYCTYRSKVSDIWVPS